MRRITLIATGAAAAAGLALSGCGVAHGHHRAAGSPHHAATTAPAAAAFRYKELSFVPLDDMKVLPAGRHLYVNTDAELQSRRTYRDYPASVQVFYMPDSVGNLGIRVAQAKDGLRQQLGGRRLRFTVDRDIPVPGTVQSHLLAYTYVVNDHGTPVHFEQRDVDLGTAENPQYSLRVSWPARMGQEPAFARLLRTLRVSR